jgi:hypothetical protein
LDPSGSTKEEKTCRAKRRVEAKARLMARVASEGKLFIVHMPHLIQIYIKTIKQVQKIRVFSQLSLSE